VGGRSVDGLVSNRGHSCTSDWGLSFAKRGERERRAKDDRRRHFASLHKWLRNALNKSEHEPTNGRSTCYGSAHLIPAYGGTGRISSSGLSF
jgi:hypothetical protein